MKSAFVGLILLAASTAAAQPAILRPVNRTVSMDPDSQRHSETVRGAPYQMTALVFPEGIDETRCGNCTEKTGEQPENWYLNVSKETGRVYLKPTRLPDAAHPLPAFVTTLYVILESGYSVTLDVRLPKLNGDHLPDAEVVFTLPKRATLSGKLLEERKRQEEAYKERLERASTQSLLSTLLGELNCEDAVGVPHQVDRLYVRVVQRCVVDAEASTYWVVFEVRNRHSGVIELKTASLSEAGADDPMLDSAKRGFRLERPTLRFNERTLGVALATLPKGRTPPAGWSLLVSEDGGSGRVVAVEDLDFQR